VLRCVQCSERGGSCQPATCGTGLAPAAFAKQGEGRAHAARRRAGAGARAAALGLLLQGPVVVVGVGSRAGGGGRGAKREPLAGSNMGGAGQGRARRVWGCGPRSRGTWGRALRGAHAGRRDAALTRTARRAEFQTRFKRGAVGFPEMRRAASRGGKGNGLGTRTQRRQARRAASRQVHNGLRHAGGRCPPDGADPPDGPSRALPVRPAARAAAAAARMEVGRGLVHGLVARAGGVRAAAAEQTG
jgi:hypothetical protein